jgi:hypothetical protein
VGGERRLSRAGRLPREGGGLSGADCEANVAAELCGLIEGELTKWLLCRNIVARLMVSVVRWFDSLCWLIFGWVACMR